MRVSKCIFALALNLSMTVANAQNTSIDSYNKFATDLLMSSYVEGKNIVISPVGAYGNLSLLTSASKPSEQFGNLTTSKSVIDGLIAAQKSSQLSNTNALWINQALKVSEPYLSQLKSDLKSDVISVADLSGKETLSRMNLLFEKTSGQKNFVKANDISANTNLVSTSSFNFNLSWAHPFNQNKTTKDVFHSYSGDVNSVFMNTTQVIAHSGTENSKMCEIKLNDDLLLIIVMPRKSSSIGELLQKTDTKEIINSDFSVSTTNLTLPQLSISSNTDLSSSLKDITPRFPLAVPNKMFEPGNATLGNMFTATSINVDEHGTEMPENPVAIHRNLVILKIDRPFLFFVITKGERAIVLEGIVHLPN